MSEDHLETPYKAPIVFTKKEFESITTSHTNPLVIKLRITNVTVSRVLMDKRSSLNIIFWEAFKRIGKKENQIQPTHRPLLEFNNLEVQPLGTIMLTVYTSEMIVMITWAESA